METRDLYNRIYILCKERGISMRFLEREFGFANGRIRKLINAQSPSLDLVEKIANYFDVTIDYLVGNTDIRSSASEILKDKDIALFQRAKEILPPKENGQMMAIIKTLVDYTSDNKEEQ